MRDAKRELLSLSDYTFQRTRQRLDGLTDEEYLWEPVAACWSVRPGPDGGYRMDYAIRPETPPFTTLAWRLWHLSGCYGQSKNARWLGVALEPPRPFDVDADAPATASEALSCLEEAHDHWRAVLLAVSEEMLDEPIGPIAVGFAEQPKVGYVLHMLDEFIHHGAEVGVLRDLFRGWRLEAEHRLRAAPTPPAR